MMHFHASSPKEAIEKTRELEQNSKHVLEKAGYEYFWDLDNAAQRYVRSLAPPILLKTHRSGIRPMNATTTSFMTEFQVVQTLKKMRKRLIETFQQHLVRFIAGYHMIQDRIGPFLFITIYVIRCGDKEKVE